MAKKAAQSRKAETLLVELLTEELPPKSLQRLSEAFAAGIADGLRGFGLLSAESATTTFATPRRLAARITGVLNKGADRPVEQKLMPISVARSPDGKASVALRKKLAGLGRESLADQFPDSSDGPDSLAIVSDGKTENVVLRSIATGQSLREALELALEKVLSRLPMPKVMSYQLSDSEITVNFVRPAHCLVALHGGEVVAIDALGLESGRKTQGHRFLSKADLSIAHADEYEEILEKNGHVIANFGKRRERISAELEKYAAGATILCDDTLLVEITALVEWPAVYEGAFDPQFLHVPEECLILSMQQHQKYVPLQDRKTSKLLPRFLFVSNLETKDPREIIHGNERVLRARLADAKFFYDQDRRERLEARVPRLAQVVYHNKLGTQHDRVERLKPLAVNIARSLGADTGLAERAAELCKADLLTGMVGEFPELQGTMGRYYALHDGEPKEVADAIESHYRPRYAGDRLPEGKVACALALADKLYTLVGIFASGGAPTGEKDPFALRRQALGVLRILMETPIPLDLFQLLRSAEEVFPKGLIKNNPNEVRGFMLDRLRNYLRERGDDTLQVEAVVSQINGLIYQTPGRLRAVKEFVKLAEAKDLAAANKRVLNIIYKNEEIRGRFVNPNRAIMKESAEIALMDAVERLAPVAKKHFESGEYEESLRLLATIKPDVDRFFDQVMVMVEDTEIRNNRAALLQQLGLLMNQVADISKLAA